VRTFIEFGKGMTSMPHENTARRAAEHAGLRAVKTRWRRNTSDNRGGFQLLDRVSNRIVAGAKFDLSPAAVMEICEQLRDRMIWRAALV
jgi:hypothetical protein